MDDVIELLERAAGARGDAPVRAQDVEADVARGRRALVRRRRRKVATRSGLFVAAAALAIGSVQLSNGSDGSAPPVANGGSSATHAPRHLHLVANTGHQVPGFHVARVPAGWTVAASDTSAFVVEPAGAPASDNWDGKIVVAMQGASTLPANAQHVTVSGRDGRLAALDGGYRWLTFTDDSGRKLLVQWPASSGLTDDQMIDFAAGVTSTGSAAEAGG